MASGQVTGYKSRSFDIVDAIRLGLAAYGLSAARPKEIADAREFAAALIGGENVSAGVLASVHRRTGGAVYLAHEAGQLTGVWANVLLTEAGVSACHADRFNALDPHPDHFAERGWEPAGAYAWCVAASTRDSRKRVVAAGDAIYRGALAHLPYFTRPATPAGVRLVIERFKFLAVASSTSGLVWMPPRERQAPSVAA
jgi:hypothetical protein